MKAFVHIERNIKQINCQASGAGLFSPTGTYRCGVCPPLFAKSVTYLKIMWQKKTASKGKFIYKKKIFKNSLL